MESPADRLRRARRAKGYGSARAAALAHGWVVSTYTSHENGTRAFRTAEASRYAKAYGLSVAELLGFASEQRGEDSAVERLPIVGEVAMGVWRDVALEESASPTQPVYAAGRDQPAGRDVYAVAVRDGSANKVIAQGEFAICRRLRSDDVIAVGDMLHIERHRGGLVERSIMRVRSVVGDRIECAPHSTEKRFAASVTILPRPSGVDAARILGKVIGRYAELGD